MMSMMKKVTSNGRTRRDVSSDSDGGAKRTRKTTKKNVQSSDDNDDGAVRKTRKASAIASKKKRAPLLDLAIVEAVHSSMRGKRKKARQEWLAAFAKYDPDDRGVVPDAKFVKCLGAMGIKLKPDQQAALMNVFRKNAAKQTAAKSVDYVTFLEFAYHVRDSEKLGAIAAKMRKAIDRFNAKHTKKQTKQKKNTDDDEDDVAPPYHLLKKLQQLDKKQRTWLSVDTFTAFLEASDNDNDNDDGDGGKSSIDFKLRASEVQALVERFEYEYGKKVVGIDYAQFAAWLQPLLCMDVARLHARLKDLVAQARRHGLDAQRVFAAMDRDASGAITAAELEEVLLEQLGLPVTDAQVRCLVDEYDTDGDGKIQYKEFAALFAPTRQEQEEQEEEEEERQLKKRHDRRSDTDDDDEDDQARHKPK